MSGSYHIASSWKQANKNYLQFYLRWNIVSKKITGWHQPHSLIKVYFRRLVRHNFKLIGVSLVRDSKMMRLIVITLKQYALFKVDLLRSNFQVLLKTLVKDF